MMKMVLHQRDPDFVPYMAAVRNYWSTQPRPRNNEEREAQIKGFRKVVRAIGGIPVTKENFP